MELSPELIKMLIPVILIQVGLAVAAIVDIVKRKSFSIGTKPIWIIIVITVSFVGPLVYFVIGRKEE